MALLLLDRATGACAARRCRRSPRCGVVGLALLPLISAQGGHGTQWIGRWPLVGTARGDPAVLPHRLLRRAAGARRRAAGGAADPRRPRARAVAHDRARARARHATATPARLLIALSIAACGVLIPIVLVALRRRLPRSAQPGRGDDPRHGGDRRRRDRAGRAPVARGSRSPRRSPWRSSRSRSTSISARACSAGTGATSPRRCAARRASA